MNGAVRKKPLIAGFSETQAIRGLGMTDDECYAKLLADKFDYTNTYYDREPRLDFTDAHPSLSGAYDFILSADVLEHIAPPWSMLSMKSVTYLRPTVFSSPRYLVRARKVSSTFRSCRGAEYRIVPLGDTTVLINRRRDGSLEITEELLFHGGPGATLEMRQLSPGELREKLRSGGFREVEFLSQDMPQFGVLFDPDVSQPLVARKEKFAMRGPALGQLIDAMQTAQKQVSLATGSKWVRLGRMLGIGPKFS